MKSNMKLLGFCIILAALILYSCALPSSYREVESKHLKEANLGRKYQKHLGIAMIKNSTAFQDLDLSDTLLDTITSHIKKRCPGITPVTYKEKNAPEFFKSDSLYPADKADNLNIAIACRNRSLQGLLLNEIISARVEVEKTGLLQKKGSKYFLEIKVLTHIIDSGTAARRIGKIASSRIEISQLTKDNIEKKSETTFSLLKSTVNDAGIKIGESICSEFGFYQFRAAVLDNLNDIIIISAGQKAGVKVGDSFEVYDASKVIEGFQGQRFVIPGFKIGEATIVSVEDDRSKARVTTKEPVPKGSLVTAVGILGGN